MIFKQRPAIAMIELIFAIVIMGIVMMGAPMLISNASQSVSVSLQQEGINEAASRVNMLLTSAWDEQDTNESCTLHTNGDAELSIVAGTQKRIGIPTTTTGDYNTFRTFSCGGVNDINASTTLGVDAGDTGKDDLDDFGNTTLVVDASGAGGDDYIEQGTVSIATAISYASDAANYAGTTIAFTPNGAAGGTSSVKAITVTVTSTSTTAELAKNIRLRAFSCNIGGYTFAKRSF